MNRIQPDTRLPKEPPEIITLTGNLYQITTAAPVLVVFYNNGELTITWTREEPGFYVGVITNYIGMTEFQLPDCATITIQSVTTGPGKTLLVGSTTNTISIGQWNGAAYVDDIYSAAFELKIYTNLAKFY